ncbi:LIC_13029 family protein [Leptospira sp. GIMC2001]|uniref:LIC_13029 family protein n=1 Tax=Leptospira sp. GIMC2001 TaxID=1513297 RepID=UPI00234B5A03|nr:hypothetical protein [Leptospira sp. GIMC2001]WCL49588.1 hypothetical protein O4O04_01865 [Leptospira sp. GIMC2001]
MTNTTETNKNFEPDKAHLLWRTFNRFKEAREGLLRLNKETSIRTFKNQPDLYFTMDTDKFIKNIAPLFSGSLITDKDKTYRFLQKFHESYRKEIYYSSNRKEHFSMDILFQVIETLFMEVGANKAESAVMNLSDQKSSITRQDLEQIMSYLKAYNKMSARFQASGNMKKAIELSDEIITSGAMEHPDIPILALDSMFNLITAQFILAQKYQCKQLLSAWRKEYGFDEVQEARIAKLLPPNTSLLDFRNNYARAIQTLQSQKEEMESEMDLFLLRTVSNYYTSWINQVANQISKSAA